MTKKISWLLILTVLLLVPSSVISENQPTRQELDSEIFHNVTFPSVVLGTVLQIKKDPEKFQGEKATSFLNFNVGMTNGLG